MYRVNFVDYKPMEGYTLFVNKDAFDYLKKFDYEGPSGIDIPEGYDGVYSYCEANIVEFPDMPYLLEGEISFYMG